MRRSFQVAGTTFRPKGDILEAFAMAETGQAEVKFVLEPDNKFDPHAVQVFIENILVGYVPRLNARHVGKIISGENGLGMQNVIVKPVGNTANKPNSGFVIELFYDKYEE